MNAPLDLQLYASKTESLKGSELFAGLDQQQLLTLASYFEWLKIAADQQVICEGEPSDYAVLVVSGAFEVSKGAGLNRRLMAFAKPGSLLGEMGLITAGPRYASCRAVQDSEIGLLTSERFFLMKGSDPALHAELVTRIALQLAGRLVKVSDAILTLKEKNDIAVEAARRILETSAPL